MTNSFMADAIVSITAFISPEGNYIAVDGHTEKYPATAVWSEKNRVMSVDIEGTDLMLVCKWVERDSFMLGVAKRRFHDDAFNETVENLNLD